MMRVFSDLLISMQLEQWDSFDLCLRQSGSVIHDIRIPDNGASLLHYAALLGTNHVHLLLNKYHMDVNIVDHSGATPMGWLITENAYLAKDVPFCLLSYGASLVEAQRLHDNAKFRWTKYQNELLAGYWNGQACCRKAVVALLTLPGVARDVRHLLAFSVWRTRRQLEWNK